MSNGNGSDPFAVPSGYGMTDPSFSDVQAGSSSSDLPGGYGDMLANYGSNMGGITPSTLGGGGQGAGISVGGRGRKTSHGHYIMGGAVYRHRMNPANPRALRRAISRVTAFERMAKRVLRITSPHHHVAGFKKHRRRR